MSRSISQIYAEAVAARNNYLQVSPLNSGRSESKLSVINIMTYIMSCLIYSYEVIMDSFQVQVAKLIADRINGTPTYYARMAKYFQYNPNTEMMDEIEYDDETFKIKFKKQDESHRIIGQSAYQNYKDTGLVLKVCKNNDNTESSEEGSIYTRLTPKELTAFKNYMDEIKFLGAKIYCLSIWGDILSINAKIVYDDTYIDENQALENVKKSLISYIKNLDFNGYVYYQSVIDAIQSADHILSVSGPDEENEYAIVSLSAFNNVTGKYNPPTNITGRCTPYSGYVTFVDELDPERKSTLVADSSHLIFQKNSEE